MNGLDEPRRAALPVDEAFLFRSGEARLVGIVTRPLEAAGSSRASSSTSSIGVLVIVGGPQYRVGSHRQFVLLARALAARGFPTMRFDCAGMGDSDGVERPFTARDGDIRAAVDAFLARCPTVTAIALWGLCDAASAALLYAASDARVRHLVLLNPWVRSDAGLARTHLKHYYGKRLLDRSFWAALVRGRVGIARALAGFVRTTFVARRRGGDADDEGDFRAAMARGWQRFPGDILLVSSGDDLTAREFADHAARDAAWRGLVDEKRVARCELAEADHTFSRAEWRDRVAALTADWLSDRVAAGTPDRRSPATAPAPSRASSTVRA